MKEQNNCIIQRIPAFVAISLNKHTLSCAFCCRLIVFTKDVTGYKQVCFEKITTTLRGVASTRTGGQDADPHQIADNEVQ